MMHSGVHLAERGFLPDPVVRWGIRRLCRNRLQATSQRRDAERKTWVEACRQGPIAKATTRANEQHYEVPAEFFATVLGARLKYSSAYWSSPSIDLAEAESSMLSLTCRRAQLADGMRVIDLGCGWGALSFWIAEHYPQCQITAVSNSATQRTYIESRADAQNLGNRLEVITADINEFELSGECDRVVSVEMFEHVHNMSALLRKISKWLREDGKLFVHHFCHRTDAYPFDLEDDHNWMAKHFFTGGMMPHHGWLSHFDDDLVVEERWWVDGQHYERTCNAWLTNMTARRAEVLPILIATYGRSDAERWYHRWRMFFMACAELFGLNRGSEWGVGHYLLSPQTDNHAT